MPELLILCGPPGSGKSTLARQFAATHTYINRDLQGKEQHFKNFDQAVAEGKNIICDKMNFLKGQRQDFINKAKGYTTKIIVLHENFETCLERMKNRVDHPTIKDEKTASKVLNMFFSKYERVEDTEADVIERRWPQGEKPLAIIVDIDGTTANIDHRLHFVHPESGKKKDWRSFSESANEDIPNNWCKDIIRKMNDEFKIVLASGRSDNYWQLTDNWLSKWGIVYNELFMRRRNDYRNDTIIKQIILDFEIKTKFTPYFCIDDRPSVCRMWRQNGLTVLQCNDKEF